MLTPYKKAAKDAYASASRRASDAYASTRRTISNMYARMTGKSKKSPKGKKRGGRSRRQLNRELRRLRF